jgi:hypothetical protein
MNLCNASSGSVGFSRKRELLRFLARTVLGLCVLSTSVATCAQSVPQLVSLSPAIGATNAAPRDSIVFVFDQTMDTTIPLLSGGGQLRNRAPILRWQLVLSRKSVSGKSATVERRARETDSRQA